MRAIEFLTEYRDRMYQYIKSIVPGFPDYVVKDWLYANFARGATQGPNWSFDTIGKDIPNILKDMGLSVDTKWQLVPNMKFTMDMWEPKTLKRLQARAGGSSKSTEPDVHIPARDAERHTTQAALAQQQGGVRKEPVIIIKTPQGYELLEGWHRTIQHFAMYPNGYVGPAYVAQSNQPVAEDNASPTKISFKVKKGRGRFATEMIVNGQQAGVYQYDANTGRSIAEVFPEFRSQGLGKILVLHAIYTAAKLGLDFQEDESRTAAYDNVLDSLSSNGYIVDDDGYWYVTGEGEQYLQQSLKNKAPPVAENFADGKGPGRPGDSVRHGIPKNATMAELEKASHSAGRKGQLARWQLNMRRGKAELSEIKQRLDAKCWQGKRKEGTKIKGGIRVNNCVPVSETGVKKPQLKTYAARVKLKQSGYTNIVDATVMARNPEMARRLLHQLYGGNSSVVGQPREIK